ncbi:MAG: hypothetical protein AAF098_06280 [Pseudomonadota bacterium]
MKALRAWVHHKHRFETPKAARAVELNTAISQLYLIASHGKDDFQRLITPVYLRFGEHLRSQTALIDTESVTLELLQHTIRACERRSSSLLPRGRPNVDYRRVHKIYTYALITAMAVEACRALEKEPPKTAETVAGLLIPEEGIKRLRHDPEIWQDWMGFFRPTESDAGLYALAHPSEEVIRSAERPLQLLKTRSAQHSIESSTAKTDTRSKVFKGERILAALRDAIAKEYLEVNTRYALINTDRLRRTHVRSPEVFQALKALNDWPETPKRLANQFERAKYVFRSSKGKSTFRGRHGAKGEWHTGFVIADSVDLWPSQAPVGRFGIDAPIQTPTAQEQAVTREITK